MPAVEKTIIANSLGSTGLTVATSFGAGTLAVICDPTVTTDDSTGTDLSITPANLVKGAIGNVTGVAKLTAGVLSAAAAGTDYLAPAGVGSALTGITASQVAPPGSTTQVVYNNAGALAGASSILVGSSGQLNLAAMSDPGSPAAGDVWYSSASGLSAYKAGLPARASTVVWSINSAGTAVANTAAGAFTSIFGGLTPPTFAANTLKAGTIIRLYLFGKHSNTGTPTLNFKVLLGSTAVLVGNAAATATTMSNNAWFMDRGSFVQVQGTGAAAATTGYAVIQGIASSGAGTAGFWGLTSTGSGVGGTVNLDTTVSNALDVQAAWGAQSSSNTLTLLGGYVEVIG